MKDNNPEDFKEVSMSNFIFHLKGMKEMGALPTFDWKELKKSREQDFLKYKQTVNEGNLMNGIEPENDNFLYQKWLEREKENAKFWKFDIVEKKLTPICESDLIQIDHYLNFLDQELNKAQNNTTKPKIKTSFVWLNNPDQELPELYKLMRDRYNLIASETTLEQFKAVFTGQPIDDSFEPIKWHQDNASELLYFNEAIKDKVNDVWHIYQRLAACFVKPDGKQFKAVWKSLKTNIDINLSLDKQKAIDELVSKF
jgi:hypothetical protein